MVVEALRLTKKQADVFGMVENEIIAVMRNDRLLFSYLELKDLNVEIREKFFQWLVENEKLIDEVNVVSRSALFHRLYQLFSNPQKAKMCTRESFRNRQIGNALNIFISYISSWGRIKCNFYDRGDVLGYFDYDDQSVLLKTSRRYVVYRYMTVWDVKYAFVSFALRGKVPKPKRKTVNYKDFVMYENPNIYHLTPRSLLLKILKKIKDDGLCDVFGCEKLKAFLLAW